jgi:Concanavalin A-like lectin/glucanases superfamily
MHQGLRLGSVVSLAALALLVVASGAGASAHTASAPAHWWQADGNAKDSVAHDNGRLGGGTGFGPGVYGPDQAFSFAGRGQRVVFNKAGGNRGSGDLTFAFDIKTTATVQQGVWEKRIACDTNGTPFWDFRTTTRGTPVGSITFEYGTPPANFFVASKTSVSDGKWHLVVATRHGRTVKLYVDGNLEAATTSATTANLSNNAPMRAGVSTCDGIDGTHAFTGELDELMIFRTVLGQPQIRALGRAEGLTG